MHLTWLPGDPVIQLNFPNPLNVSVQVGDVAYFSNPTAVGQAQEWTATTTPHLANPQGGVIMIGEIIQIIPWNGTVSSIICNMPQTLFNQYFAQIIAGGCIYPPAVCIGDCDRIDPGIGLHTGNFDAFGNITSGGPQMPNHPYFGTWPPASTTFLPNVMARNWFFANPTFHVDDYKFHSLQATNNPLPSTYCYVLNSDPFYNPLFINYYNKVRHFYFEDPANSGNQSSMFYTANDILTELIAQYPNAGFSLGMTWPQTSSVASSIGIGMYGFMYPIQGSCEESPDPVVCTQGSFIMFSKDNKVNMSDMLGYYASVEFRNNSTTEAELFNVGTTFFESSK